MKINKQHKGQVALVLVLIMTVVSALAVSLASRSTVDTRIQQTETESIQALLFSQTGIEQLMMNPLLTFVNVASYSATRTDTGMDSYTVSAVSSGSAVELNLVGADFGTLTGFSVNWGPESGNPSGQPAVYVSVIESTGKITDRAFDYGGLNGFSTAGDGSEGYAKTSGTIPVTGTVIKVRIAVLGASALLKVVPVGGAGASFPSQIKSIKSIGSVLSGNNSVKYGLQFDESMAVVPAVFDYTLFSGGSIIQ